MPAPLLERRSSLSLLLHYPMRAQFVLATKGDLLGLRALLRQSKVGHLVSSFELVTRR
jgi:hypothetical protein